MTKKEIFPRILWQGNKLFIDSVVDSVDDVAPKKKKKRYREDDEDLDCDEDEEEERPRRRRYSDSKPSDPKYRIVETAICKLAV